MTAIQNTFFDYAELDTETRIVVQQRTTEIKALMKRAAADIIEIGQKLIEVKARLGHGNFGGWLKTEFDWHSNTAGNFMRVAEQFKNTNFVNLDLAPSALYLLAAPSTPESARIEAIARAEEGEPITFGKAQGIVHDHRYPSDPYSTDDGEPLTPYEEQIAARYVHHNDFEATREQEYYEDSAAYAEEVERAGAMKPKINRAGDTNESRGFDRCQTPPEAIDPLLPYLPMGWLVWEPACGEGTLIGAFYDASRNVIGSDILTGDNFFTSAGPDGWDCIVTNPPYSVKYEWLERCYQLGRPFALLLPIETLGAQRAQRLFADHGVELILLNRRVNFKMPNIGWDGSAAQFPVAWFTWNLNLEAQIVFGRLP